MLNLDENTFKKEHIYRNRNNLYRVTIRIRNYYAITNNA